MPIWEGLDQSKVMDEVLKTVVYFHKTLDDKKEDLEDAIDDILSFYDDETLVDQDDFDLDGNEIKLKVIKPLSRSNQKTFDDSISTLSKETSGVFVVSNYMKKQLYELGTERIKANVQNEQVKPQGEGLLEKAQKLVVPNLVEKKHREYATLNEVDDPFKISKSTVEEIENFAKQFDKFVDTHHFGIEMAEETDIAGQKTYLRSVEINFFKARVLPKLNRLIEEANRIQREAERIESIKALIQGKQEADRARNAMLGMMPPNQSQ